MAGVPARRIGWVGHSGSRLGHDLVCPDKGGATRRPPMAASSRYLDETVP